MENELRELIIKYGKSMMPRLVEHEIVSSKANIVIIAVIMAICAVVCIGVFVYVKQKKDKGEFYEDVSPTLAYILCLLVSVVCIALIICEIHDIITATYMPEKILIRYIDILLGNM